MSFCSSCGKKETRTRKITNYVCNECTAVTNDDLRNTDNAENEPAVAVDVLFPDDFLNKSLMDIDVSGLVSVINTINNKTLVPEIKKLAKDVNATKVALTNTKKELAKAQGEIVNLKTEVRSLTDDLNNARETSNNNLKYLVNHDRNVRSENIVIFGVPEKGTIESDAGIVATSDTEKIAFLFRYIGVDGSTVKSFFRLGKEGDKPRMLKVTLHSREHVKRVLTKSANLKEYEAHNIQIRPDKSKSEQREFTRLGKRKKELLEQNDTPDDQQPRVKLEKGVLTLDGVEVDRYNPVQSIF